MLWSITKWPTFKFFGTILFKNVKKIIESGPPNVIIFINDNSVVTVSLKKKRVGKGKNKV